MFRYPADITDRNGEQSHRSRRWLPRGDCRIQQGDPGPRKSQLAERPLAFLGVLHV